MLFRSKRRKPAGCPTTGIMRSLTQPRKGHPLNDPLQNHLAGISRAPAHALSRREFMTRPATLFGALALASLMGSPSVPRTAEPGTKLRLGLISAATYGYKSLQPTAAPRLRCGGTGLFGRRIRCRRAWPAAVGGVRRHLTPCHFHQNPSRQERFMRTPDLRYIWHSALRCRFRISWLFMPGYPTAASHLLSWSHTRETCSGRHSADFFGNVEFDVSGRREQMWLAVVYEKKKVVRVYSHDCVDHDKIRPLEQRTSRDANRRAQPGRCTPMNAGGRRLLETRTRMAARVGELDAGKAPS